MTQKSDTHQPLKSMTGFSTAQGEHESKKFKVEIRSLNHRYLDIKTRLPKDLNSIDVPLRAEVQKRFSRGAIDIKIERIVDSESAGNETQVNLGLAAHYYECLSKIQKTLGLTDEIRVSDIAHFPEVLSWNRGLSDPSGNQSNMLWESLRPTVCNALENLQQMRAQEGSQLEKPIGTHIQELGSYVQSIKKRRAECSKEVSNKIKEKIQRVFENYPIENTDAKTLLESRIAQELSIILDRLDIEEELNRLEGHMEHFRSALKSTKPVGRKLEFILQEIHREINTLGNKAQDLKVSNQVVQSKLRVEQLREQVMNIE